LNGVFTNLCQASSQSNAMETYTKGCRFNASPTQPITGRHFIITSLPSGNHRFWRAL